MGNSKDRCGSKLGWGYLVFFKNISKNTDLPLKLRKIHLKCIFV